MDELPQSIVFHLQHMFAVAEADRATGLLRTAAARLASQGLAVDQAERALTACLMAADRRLPIGPGGDRTPSRRLREVAAAADRVTTDTRGVLIEAGVEPTDWHSHLVWVPARLPVALSFPRPLDDLIRACETRCVTACCGLDAYEVRADNLIRWATGHGGLYGLATALEQLEVELATVAGVPGSVGGHDTMLYHDWDTASDCLAYFEDWRTEATRALAAVGGAGVVRPEWLSADVRAVLAGIVEARDFRHLPILADALEDAGCDSRLVLAHLRAGGRHGWFCWAADLLAGH